MDVKEAAQLMSQQQIHRLPVVKNGLAVGMVALGDIAVDSQYDAEAEEALTAFQLLLHLKKNCNKQKCYDS